MTDHLNSPSSSESVSPERVPLAQRYRTSGAAIQKLRLDPYDNDAVSLAYAINAKLDEIIDRVNQLNGWPND